jgi:integrase
MSVRKRKWTTRKGEVKEAWLVDYLQDGKRHVETFDRKKDAVAREHKVRLDIGKGIHVAASNSITVAEAARNWLNEVEANGRERSTLRQYRQHVDLHIVPRLGNVKLAKLTAATVENFRNQMIGNGNGNGGDKSERQDLSLSRPLARKVLTSFKMLLKVAKFSHVAADVKIGSTKRERRLEAGTDFPAPDEVRRLAEAAKSPRQRALLLTAIFTGLRASELRGLRWKDVDLVHGELHVRQRADRFGKIGAPKSRAGARTILLPAEVIAALKYWKPLGPKAKARGDDRLVFPSATGHVQHHTNMFHGLAPVMIAAGVVDENGAPKYAMHAFRHFFASWCINPKARGGRELTAKVVQALLGHASIVITLDTYGHLFPNTDDRAELADATAALLGGPATGEVVPLAKQKRLRPPAGFKDVTSSGFGMAFVGAEAFRKKP